MCFMDDLGRLGESEREGTIRRFQDRARLETVSMAGGLISNDDGTLPGGQVCRWPGLLLNKEEIALTSVKLHSEAGILSVW